MNHIFLCSAIGVSLLAGYAAAEPAGPRLAGRTPLAPSPARFTTQAATRFALAPSRPELIPAPQPVVDCALGLLDVEAIALRNNPTLRQASAEIEAARGRWVQAGLPPNPVGGYTAAEIGEEGAAGQQGGFIGQEFVTGGKLRLSRQVAAQEIRLAQQQFAAQRLRVVGDVRAAFYDVLIAQQMLQIAQKLSGIGEQGVEAAQSLLEAQEVSRADVLQARIERDSTRILINNARNRHLSAWRRLAAVAGVPQMHPAHLNGQVDDDLPTFVWEDTIMRLVAQSPEVAAAQARLARARWAAERSRVEPVPNLELQASVQHDNATGDEIAGVQAGVPIPILNRNQGNIRETQAELISARNEIGRVQLALQQRLATTFEQYANSRQQVEIYSRDILPQAQANLDLVGKGYRLGEFNFIALLTAQRTYFQTNIAYLNALLELRRSVVAMENYLLADSLQEQRPQPLSRGR